MQQNETTPIVESITMFIAIILQKPMVFKHAPNVSLTRCTHILGNPLLEGNSGLKYLLRQLLKKEATMAAAPPPPHALLGVPPAMLPPNVPPPGITHFSYVKKDATKDQKACTVPSIPLLHLPNYRLLFPEQSDYHLCERNNPANVLFCETPSTAELKTPSAGMLACFQNFGNPRLAMMVVQCCNEFVSNRVLNPWIFGFAEYSVGSKVSFHASTKNFFVIMLHNYVSNDMNPSISTDWPTLRQYRQSSDHEIVRRLTEMEAFMRHNYGNLDHEVLLNGNPHSYKYTYSQRRTLNMPLKTARKHFTDKLAYGTYDMDFLWHNDSVGGIKERKFVQGMYYPHLRILHRCCKWIDKFVEERLNPHVTYLRAYARADWAQRRGRILYGVQDFNAPLQYAAYHNFAVPTANIPYHNLGNLYHANPGPHVYPHQINPVAMMNVGHGFGAAMGFGGGGVAPPALVIPPNPPPPVPPVPPVVPPVPPVHVGPVPPLPHGPYLPPAFLNHHEIMQVVNGFPPHVEGAHVLPPQSPEIATIPRRNGAGIDDYQQLEAETDPAILLQIYHDLITAYDTPNTVIFFRNKPEYLQLFGTPPDPANRMHVGNTPTVLQCILFLMNNDLIEPDELDHAHCPTDAAVTLFLYTRVYKEVTRIFDVMCANKRAGG